MCVYTQCILGCYIGFVNTGHYPLFYPISTDICYSPVYIHPHSKVVLMRAIQEDTEFLARNAIMDYSLLTCIDDQTGELVVGIIGRPDIQYQQSLVESTNAQKH